METEQDKYDATSFHEEWHKPNPLKKIVFGLLLVTAGSLLVLFNLGRIDPSYKHIIFSWQTLLIALGIINLFNRRGWGVGYLLIGIGTFFIIPELKVCSYNYVQLFWPVLLILAGITIIIRRICFPNSYNFRHFHHHQRFHRHHSDFHKKIYEKYQANYEKKSEGFIDVVNIFSGSKQNFANQEFKGANLVNIFGGTKLNLNDSMLVDDKCEIEVVCVFGGIELIIPSDWNIKIEVVSILGGFADKRRVINNSDSVKTVYIRGVAVLGGGEIKSIN